MIKAATGEEITHEELGGSDIHNRESGVAHFKAESEEKCFQLLRELLTYIPSSSRVDPPQGDSEDSADRESQELNEIIPPNPNLGYDVKDVIKTILDHESFLRFIGNFA